MTETLLRAEGLERYYGDRRAVAGVDVTLARGEVLGLLGPNGAGKSTVMRLLSGALPPSAGQIIIDGYDLLDNARAAKRSLGYLPELPPVYPEMAVADYLAYCAALRGVPRREVRAAVHSALERCALTDVRQRLIGKLSKGYQQRVGIAQAIVHRPRLVILDEPTVGLDPLQIRAVRELIGALRADHGVIISSHILPEIQSLCDRVIILNRGRSVYTGTLNAIDTADECAYVIGLARPPALDRLTALSGVEAIEPLDAGRWRLVVRDEAAAQALLGQVLAQGWGLREWSPAHRSLERLFVALTHGEDA